MKRWLLSGLGILLLLPVSVAVAFLSGPLFCPRLTATKVTLPEDLEGYLAASEAAAGKVKPHREKTILWADPQKKGQTPYAIIYFHGFSASRADLSPVIEEVGAALHANVFMTRWAGHGLETSKEAMGQVRAQDWINDAQEALEIGRRLGNRVVAIGMSTGSLLALHTAFQSPDVSALVLLSPNYHPADHRAYWVCGPLGGFWARRLVGPYFTYSTSNPEHDEYWITCYRSEALARMMDLVHYAEGLDLSRLRQPVLTIYTTHDGVVDLDLVRARSAQIKSKGSRIRCMEDFPQHELAGRIVYPKGVPILKQAILEFLGSLGPAKDAGKSP